MITADTTISMPPATPETERRSGDSCPAICSVSGLTHLDLFSGIGGFALAAQRTGWKTIGFSEIETYACKILAQKFPGVPNFGDIRNVRGVRADLITGGFPCQPYSTAGKRGGASDDRALWPEMFRVIGETRPAWVLGENVPGIISMELDRVLSDLESLGYAAWPIGIPACAVDAKHRRERIWIVAYSEHERRNSAALNRKSASHDSGQTQPQEQTEQSAGSHPVADADKTGRREQRRAEPIQQEHSPAEYAGETIPDANLVNGHRSGHGAGAISQQQTSKLSGGETLSNDGLRGSERTRREIGGESQPARWQPEPGMGRVADGIPNRSHRLRGLGNAIVPQVAETLMREMARTLNDGAKPSRRL